MVFVTVASEFTKYTIFMNYASESLSVWCLWIMRLNPQSVPRLWILPLNP